MPWCPHCDEEFPEGPSCPRCRAPLVDVDDTSGAAELSQVVNLPQLKVPRRIRRAFERSNRAPGPPRPLFMFTMAFILFAGGFVIGRTGSIGPDGPVIRQRVEPFPAEVGGAIDYLGWIPGPGRERGLLRMDLTTGDIDVIARFSWPFPGQTTTRERSRVAASAGSVALLLNDGERSFVGAFPGIRPLPLWLDGVEAAWQDPSTLLVLGRGGTVTRWAFAEGLESGEVQGSWTAAHQTADGALLESMENDERVLWRFTDDGPRRVMSIPPGSRLLGVAPGGERAAIAVDGTVKLWDGTDEVPVRGVDGYDATAAGFSASGERVAVTMHETGRAERATRVLAIVDASGNAALKPFTIRSGGHDCTAVPAWGGGDRWVFLTPGDGWIYGVDASGGRVRTVNAGASGCGMAWLG